MIKAGLVANSASLLHGIGGISMKGIVGDLHHVAHVLDVTGHIAITRGGLASVADCSLGCRGRANRKAIRKQLLNLPDVIAVSHLKAVAAATHPH